ncbi:UDP-2,3-diacylglucosamine diphosphatase [Glaciimonas immobilis]|uniref:UDP-2,3-diacylglucosamine hydrolase n=1 Tax=Glaciimonas immobilis TaxID=728004 RepID=A0A840RMG6_9BURK|nr:UDP-2,3-diacylglucosamine diphosphatase [Glaciimonas immobilis]KAF3998885.1 UDP-2,3-diacylglucosamine diphosphatase [Glaciimonas immobilis]MBB5198282.1 UDP-2,3-diacylglucosamine hydrolase [Glaciimonas immobilis]
MSEAIFFTPAQASAVALFISDLHLQEANPRTTQAFYDFLDTHARHAAQLYLLGDLFEYWAGDDDLETPYNLQIATAIRQISDAGVSVFWIAGNRDFLVGESFAQVAGLTLLQDPFVALIGGRRVALAHGDAQCTDDLDYMAFRAQVRNPQWQQQFLALPLTQRKAIIAGARTESRKEQQHKSMEIMDVNPQAIATLFAETGTDTLIHGHTHRPALHSYAGTDVTLSRYVLPDWEYDVVRQRGGWISIDTEGRIRRFGYTGQELR